MKPIIELIKTRNRLEKLDEIYPEIVRIQNFSKRFYNLSIDIINKNKQIINLFTAKTFLESCLTTIKSIIEPEENKFIKKVNDNLLSSDILEKYFENFMSILDSKQDDLKDSVKESKILFPPFHVTVNIKSFRETLIDFMNDLVVLPLINSVKKYKIIEKDIPIDKRQETFEYFLFREVFISSKIKGSQLRQKVSLSAHTLGSFHETNIIKQGRPRAEKKEFEIITPPEIKDFPIYFEEKDEEEEDAPMD